MSHSRLLLSLLFIGATPAVQAQRQLPKMDGALSRMVIARQSVGATARQHTAAPAPATAAPTVIVRCSDAEAETVAQFLADSGHASRIILPTLLTTTVPTDFLTTLASHPSVESITTPTQYHPTMTEAREIAGVDAIHSADRLDTPFKGRGVVLGVIDQGFEYRHPAFLDADGNSRVKAVWNRTASLETKPLYTIPSMGDKGGGGHATHVSNIAAGSETGNHLYGVAPEAELIMIPSPFLDYEVLEDVGWIKSMAEAEGKPWVVNMSFGTTVGPHDGTGGCCAEIDALTGAGALIVAAMGNEGGQALHLSATIQPDEPRYILCKGGDDGYLFVDFWANDPDAQAHFRFTPITYVNYKMSEQDADFWHNVMPDDVHTGSYEELNVRNGKQHAQYIIDVATAARSLSTSYNASKSIVGFKIELAEGETTPHTFHAWIGEGHGSFSTVGISGQKASMLAADSHYLVAEGTACIPSAVAVGAYNSNVKFTTLRDGAMYDYTRYVGPVGGMSTFSNSGPWLGEGTPKPLVAAPGSVIKSAVSKLAEGFDANDPTIVDKITDDSGHDFYYSVMQGTSMASPFVAGALCLWLEANPGLTPADIEYIIRQTAVVEEGIEAEYTLNDDGTRQPWSPRAGYGRIDVYEGLKLALSLADRDGIERLADDEQPFTLQKGDDGWRILFNRSENAAEVSIVTVEGRVVRRSHLGPMRQGAEHTLSFSGLPAGTYLVRLATARSTMTRRVLLR